MMSVIYPSNPYLGNNETSPSFEYFYEEKKLGWNVDDPEFLEMIHPYWKKFDAPNPFLNYMLGFFYVIFMVVALIGNGVVLWVFTSAKSLRTPSNMLVIHLALFDFIMMTKTPLFIANSFNNKPIYGMFGCNMYALLGAWSGTCGALTNAAIAYDRYKAIAKPFEPKMNAAKTLLLILGINLYAAPWVFLPLLKIWGRYIPEGFLTACTFDYMSEDMSNRMFVLAMFVFVFLIPGILIVYFYGKVYGHVKEHEKKMKEQAKKMNVSNLRSASAEDKEKSVEIRILKVSVGLFALFLISWGPYATIALMGSFGDRSKLNLFVCMIPALTCKAVACLDPWVYAINHPKYRLELQKRLPWFCIHEPEDDSTTIKSSETTTVCDKA